MFVTRSLACRGLAALIVAMPFAATGQQVETDTKVLSEDITGRLDGFSYTEGPESELEFRGTAIALGAAGEGEVEFQDGRARVEIEVRKIAVPRPPRAFLNLRVVGRDGRWPRQQYRLDRNGGRKLGSLETSTSLSQFALIVSAEPHFAVTAPAADLVLQQSREAHAWQARSMVPGLRSASTTRISPQKVDPKAK